MAKSVVAWGNGSAASVAAPKRRREFHTGQWRLWSIAVGPKHPDWPTVGSAISAANLTLTSNVADVGPDWARSAATIAEPESPDHWAVAVVGIADGTGSGTATARGPTAERHWRGAATAAWRAPLPLAEVAPLTAAGPAATSRRGAAWASVACESGGTQAAAVDWGHDWTRIQWQSHGYRPGTWYRRESRRQHRPVGEARGVACRANGPDWRHDRHGCSTTARLAVALARWTAEDTGFDDAIAWEQPTHDWGRAVPSHLSALRRPNGVESSLARSPRGLGEQSAWLSGSGAFCWREEHRGTLSSIQHQQRPARASFEQLATMRSRELWTAVGLHAVLRP